MLRRGPGRWGMGYNARFLHVELIRRFVGHVQARIRDLSSNMTIS
jgi:hypothetical protein